MIFEGPAVRVDDVGQGGDGPLDRRVLDVAVADQEPRIQRLGLELQLVQVAQLDAAARGGPQDRGHVGPGRQLEQQLHARLGAALPPSRCQPRFFADPNSVKDDYRRMRPQSIWK